MVRDDWIANENVSVTLSSGAGDASLGSTDVDEGVVVTGAAVAWDVVGEGVVAIGAGVSGDVVRGVGSGDTSIVAGGEVSLAPPAAKCSIVNIMSCALS